MNMQFPHFNTELTHALADGRAALLTLLNRAALSLDGVKTLTMLSHEADISATRRVGTSDAGTFPLSVSEPMQDSAWHKRIFAEKKPVIANTPDEMTPFYPEADELASLGFGAIISSPIILGGQVRGVLNILGDRGMLSADLLSEIEKLNPIAALVFAFDEAGGR